MFLDSFFYAQKIYKVAEKANTFASNLDKHTAIHYITTIAIYSEKVVVLCRSQRVSDCIFPS